MELIMTKKPAIEHVYDRKKDRFDIQLKHFSLEKKRLRAQILENISVTLDKKSQKHGKHVRTPIKDTRLEEVGD
jgi:hypothetical protein